MDLFAAFAVLAEWRRAGENLWADHIEAWAAFFEACREPFPMLDVTTWEDEEP